MSASGLWFSVVCVLCVVAVQPGLVNVCFSYVDQDGLSHEKQECGRMYCCGDCTNRFCCGQKKSELTQELCPESSLTKSQVALIVGSTVGTVVAVVLFVSLVICCVAPCCLCYKKCRKRPEQRQIIVMNSSSAVHPPQPTGYQSVPSAPPPSYQESTNPTHFPAPSGLPLQPGSQPGAPPPYSDEPQQPAYNPAC